MPYDEWRIAPDVEVWRNTGSTGQQRILPDGCLDVLVLDGRPLVAGPDTAARVHDGEAHEPVHRRTTARRTRAALLGVPADELRDQTLPLEDALGRPAPAALTSRSATARRRSGEWARRLGPGSVRTPRPRPPGRAARRSARSPMRSATARASCTAARCPSSATAPSTSAGCCGSAAVTGGRRRARWSGGRPAAGYADQAHLARDVPCARRRHADRAARGTCPIRPRRGLSVCLTSGA